MSSEKLKEVPMNVLRSEYWISSSGKLYRIGNDSIEVTPHRYNNELWVGVIVNGTTHNFNLGSLMALCYCNIKITLQDVGKIKPIYKDGNSSNLDEKNITYAFNGPFEDPLNKGYFIVPFFTMYAISTEGVLIGRFNKRVYNWGKTTSLKNKTFKGSYRTSVAFNDLLCRRSTISRHRSMCLVFNQYTSDPANLVVNHKDGVPGSDDPKNLELVTHQANTRHAFDNNLHPSQVVPVCYKNWITGEESNYRSIADAVSKLGLSYDFIKKRLKTCNQRYRFLDGHCFKRDDDTKWLFASGEVIRTINDLDTVILSHNVKSGKTEEHLSTVRAGKTLGLSQATIAAHIRHNRHHPIGDYVFRKKSDNPIFPKFTERDILTFENKTVTNRIAQPLIARNECSKEEIFFPNPRLAGIHFNLEGDHIVKMAHLKRKVKGFDLSFYEIPTNY